MLLSLGRERENEQLLITCEINEFDFGDDGEQEREQEMRVRDTAFYRPRKCCHVRRHLSQSQLNSRNLGSAHVMSVSSRMRMQFTALACMALHSNADPK